MRQEHNTCMQLNEFQENITEIHCLVPNMEEGGKDGGGGGGGGRERERREGEEKKGRREREGRRREGIPSHLRGALHCRHPAHYGFILLSISLLHLL